MFLFLTVTLVDQEYKPVVVQNRERQMTPLVGVTNTTLHRITVPDKDHSSQSVLQGVFALTDLSVRQEGLYHLRFDLFEIVDGETLHRTEVYSDKFQVYPAKSFPGMQQSTPYTDNLKKHGIRVRVSKSIRTSKTRANQVDPESKLDPDVGEQHRLQNTANAQRHHPYAPEMNHNVRSPGSTLLLIV